MSKSRAGQAALFMLDTAIGATAYSAGHAQRLGRRTGDLTGVALGRLGSVTEPLVTVARRPLTYAAEQRPARSLVAIARLGAQYRDGAVVSVAARTAEAVPGLADLVLDRVDLTALVQRHLDLVTITEDLIADVDLPEIIRVSTGAVASDAVRSVRMHGISADEAVGRTIGRMLPRRRGQGTDPRPG